ncbi:putative phosphatase regulatory subunit-domain-containing protein [Radiomyces spectabilis]|uniref:putative phosphatase regulatory subunit-domain-containing protein n=1 Tax=Radiomyces spectabilis TaxID=64574 RepID=UPI00221EB01F|nr:putative phosphatase regulatory subunit-domain-containing protein [Radiomyces spectabilis]KAI8379743.1 putative phosphatase regulatory subunit-domain-containing protein [Radiomyces spectabilis]
MPLATLQRDSPHAYNRRVSLQKTTVRRTPSLSSLSSPSRRNSLKARTQPKKSVRFRDACDVRLFIQSQMPAAVHSDPKPFLPPTWRISKLNWTPGLTFSRDAKVQLESVQLTHSDMCEEPTLVGCCRVANLAFKKHVTVRYSLDYWNSFVEIDAEYCDSIANGTWDRFSFTIPLVSQQVVRTVYLALCYTVNGTEYWDNNSGRNYQIDLVEHENPVEIEPHMRKPVSIIRRHLLGETKPVNTSPEISSSSEEEEDEEDEDVSDQEVTVRMKSLSVQDPQAFSSRYNFGAARQARPWSPITPSVNQLPLLTTGIDASSESQQGYQTLISKYCFCADSFGHTPTILQN